MRRLLARLLVLLGVFLALDFLGGWLHYPVQPPRPPSPFRQLHPVYHHGFAPGFVGEEPWGARAHPMVTNSLGMKDREPRTIDVRAEAPRVLFLGDSFVEGVGTAHEETFVGLVEEALRDEGVEILNGGVTSYSPKLEYLRLRYLLEEKGLRITDLELFLDVSDVHDETLYAGFTPGTPPREDPFRPPDPPVPFWEYSLTLHLVKYLVLGATWHEDAFFERFLARRGGWTSPTEPAEAWVEAGLASCARQVAGIHELCRANGIALRITVYPWPLQIERRELDSRQVMFWRDFTRKRGIEFLNLFPVFISGEPRKDSSPRLFIDGDVHWSKAGHRLVADTWLANRAR